MTPVQPHARRRSSCSRHSRSRSTRIGDLRRARGPGAGGRLRPDLGRRGTPCDAVRSAHRRRCQDALKALREQFRAGEPVAFAADIATATRLDQVLIEEMGVRELAGRPQRFEYAFALREFTPAPVPQTAAADQPRRRAAESRRPARRARGGGRVEGEPDFDFSTATRDGRRHPGRRHDALNRTRRPTGPGTWRQADLTPGEYTARAVTLRRTRCPAPASTALQAGQPTHVQIILRRGAVSRPPSSCTSASTRRSSSRACAACCATRCATPPPCRPELVIVGHTDKTGSDAYNQSLSERRARSVFAFVTSGRDAAAARGRVAGTAPTGRRRAPQHARLRGARTSTSACCRTSASTQATSTASTARRRTTAVGDFRRRGTPRARDAVDDAVWTRADRRLPRRR